ncbi:dTDP-glucose 4,6-dehydratase [Gemmata sp. SH-PL17]|uniref:NAD-dependent epimerase/dehydratase family protein n=1 Tax=Gemmata sp. SH-PL17 TaxID=1630693 RepID=UPI00078D1CBB|nr:NAD(P)-dependent oxidoreductase [Gemmata sp. SH-PL17]AMV25618.1 dTDP-glucose 4,6-dehydratase [Gemmata sp. SH-PL17]
MVDTLTGAAPRCVLLGRAGFFATALAARLRPLLGDRLRVVGSAELDLTSAGSADRLGEIVDGDTVLIVPARAPRGPDPFRTFTDDVAIATAVARCVVARRPRRCVYFSSSAVYGDATCHAAITEQTAVAPSALYGVSKLAAEGVIRHAAERAAVPLVTLRPCMVYGPGDTTRPYGPGAFLHSALHSGKVQVFGDGSEVRDYLFVRDLAEITAALAFNGSPGVYNLATGQSHSFRQLWAHLRALVGRPFEVVSVPRDRARTDQTFDIARLRAALPDLRFTPLEKGLADTVASVPGAGDRS